MPTPHVLQRAESYVGKAYKNSDGITWCVEFIIQTLHAPPVGAWSEGAKVGKVLPKLTCGTAIATFVNGVYPQSGSTGMHAAIYLDQDETGLIVVDQWRIQGQVKKRTIPFAVQPGTSRSNDGNAFSVILW